MGAACLLAHRVHTARVVAGRHDEPSHEAVVGARLEVEAAIAVIQLHKDYRETHSGSG